MKPFSFHIFVEPDERKATAIIDGVVLSVKMDDPPVDKMPFSDAVYYKLMESLLKSIAGDKKIPIYEVPSVQEGEK